MRQRGSAIIGKRRIENRVDVSRSTAVHADDVAVISIDKAAATANC